MPSQVPLWPEVADNPASLAFVEWPIDRDFDVDFADEIARLESYNKHLYRPNTYLHKWWARRCGTTFRTILKSFVRDSELRDFYAPGGLDGYMVVDPMMGGGTTLHEAIRLGANVYGGDIDPIPILQARASLTRVPLRKLEATFKAMQEHLRDELGWLFETTCPYCSKPSEIRFTLLGIEKCNATDRAIVVDTYNVRHEQNGDVYALNPDTYQVTLNGKPIGVRRSDSLPPLIEKDDQPDDFHSDRKRPFWSRYVPLVICGKCDEHDQFFKGVDDDDLALFERIVKHRETIDFGDHKAFAIQTGPKSRDLLNRSVASYLDVFSARQLVYIDAAKRFLATLDSETELLFGLLVSTSLEFNSMLCGYKGAGKRRPGAIRHVFSHHAYSFPYTALENNPVYSKKASGTLEGLFHYKLRRAFKWAEKPRERLVNPKGSSKFTHISKETDFGEEVDSPSKLQAGSKRFYIRQGSSTNLDLDDDSADFIVTDPPYYDSVQYSDLAQFFRVWLHNFFPLKADWNYAHSGSAVDTGDGGTDQYEHILGQIFSECHRVLKKDSGRLVFTFHHWNPKGWAALTGALKRAKFGLTNFYVVHAENPQSVHIANLNALIHDSVLVFAPIESVSDKWVLPTSIRTSDSRTFCSDCSHTLGYMLQSQTNLTDISIMWDEMFSRQVTRTSKTPT